MGNSGDTSANIYESMLLSPAWMDLKPSAKILYLTCKSQYYAEKKKPFPDERDTFTMNQHKWCEKYQLYRKDNARGFYRDMTALIEHGFINCEISGANTRTKSVYRFSARWRAYGTESFTVPVAAMTSSMNRKYRVKE